MNARNNSLDDFFGTGSGVNLGNTGLLGTGIGSNVGNGLLGILNSNDLADKGFIGNLSGANTNAAFNRDIYKQNLAFIQNIASQLNAQQHQQNIQNNQNAFNQSQNILGILANKDLQNNQAAINNYLQNASGEINKNLQNNQAAINNFFQDKANAYNYYMDTHKVQNNIKDMLSAGINPALASGSIGSLTSAPRPASSFNGGSSRSVSSNFVGNYGFVPKKQQSIISVQTPKTSFSTSSGGSSKNTISKILKIGSMLKYLL